MFGEKNKNYTKQEYILFVSTYLKFQKKKRGKSRIARMQIWSSLTLMERTDRETQEVFWGVFCSLS